MTDELGTPRAPGQPPAPASELIDRYLANECTPDEQLAIRRWLNVPDAPDRAIGDLRAALAEYPGAAQNPPLQLHQIANSVSQRASTILAGTPSPDTPSLRKPRESRLPYTRTRRWMMYGAAAVAAIAVAYWVPSRYSSTAAVPVADATTARAEQTQITLPDGSTVMLAPESKVHYTGDSLTRSVTLVGQAFFDVAPNAHHPFIVTAGGTTTRVLGTAFEIQSYAHSPVRVSVTHGAVATGRSGQAQADYVRLTPGMVATFTDSSISTKTGTASAVTRWTEGELVFDDTPVPHMLATVGRWYGYEFRVTDSVLTKRHVTTVLHIGKPDELMRALKDLLDVTITREGSIVTLRPQPYVIERGPQPKRRPFPERDSSLVRPGK